MVPAVVDETHELNTAEYASKTWATSSQTAVVSDRSPVVSPPNTRPARQTPIAWMSAVFTLILLILTALYASQTTFASSIRVIYSSSSHAIFVLRALSELTGLLLATTIAAAFERIQWLFIVKRHGLRLTDYLALQAGTGVMGLLLLAVGRGVSRISTRLWSVVRLISVLLVPVLGVLLMSKLNLENTLCPKPRGCCDSKPLPSSNLNLHLSN